MSFTPFKIKVDPDVLSSLQGRNSVYKSGPHYEAATRNPAYCIASCAGVTAPEYPQEFSSIYQGSFKPGPILKQCVIRSGGDFGLIVEADVEIQCHTKDQFSKVERAFCRLGNIMSIRFGYGNPRKGTYGGGSFKDSSGFRICRFSFSSTAEGFWIVKATGIAPGASIREISVLTRIESNGRTYLNEDVSSPVAGMGELILYYAQKEGTVALDTMQDGELITTALGPLLVYKSDHLYGNAGTDMGGAADKTKPEAKTANNVVYVSLQFIVDMFNKELFPVVKQQVAAEHQDDFSKMQIVFDTTYSFSYVAQGIRSAYPTKILLLGIPTLGGKSGDYVPLGLGGVLGAGKDFEKGPGLPGLRVCYDGSVNGRDKIKPTQIYFEKDVVVSAFNKNYTEPSPADSTDVKNTDEGGVKVERFFNDLFTTLSEATGGIIKLRLTMHPDVSKGSDSGAADIFHKMIIVDENNGYFAESMPCIVFNPIDGDGSTRSCVIQSEVGSKEYQGWAFASVKKKADPCNEATGVISDGTTSGRDDQAEKAKQSIFEIVKNPGPLGRSAFDEIHMAAIREQLGTMFKGASSQKKMDMCVYPGLGMDVELDGVWGFQPGNAIMSTQVPSEYFTAKTYFFVESVEHVFDGASSDWSTRLKSKLSFNDSVNYEYL